ncbi:uncharacterized protein LOC127115041 [Lathyrus oleraceus]|uniref:uncharacterized protein LOC127107667 n=1 Tax=Pisum sativum TaxID=3888 RepID=UPI0021D20FC1|nr:uncharacterized protein LOC127107667 [Pisum sativum]XP_050902676.1 uncharacterized protein LOC127115041 [Pisum sativum]
MTEAGDLANSENLRMKYFPSSLTKNASTWFTTLPPHSIDTWPYFERLFHEQFYMGQTKISLKELASIKRKFTEPIDDYLNRNPIETEKNDRFPKKTYTFDVTKYDEIFDLLVKDGKMIVPPNTKIPSLEQRKKRGFCKYPNLLGHKTSQCFLFRDLIQNAIKDGRLKFTNKGKNQMKIDVDPLNIADTNYAEPVEIDMIDMVEVEAVKETGTEGYVLDGKQATDGLNNDVPFEISVKGE